MSARDGVLDLLHDPLDPFRFVDEPVGAKPDRLDAAVVAAGTGVDDHGGGNAALLQQTEHLEAVRPRHFEVEDHAIDRLPLQNVERRVTAVRNDGLVSADALEVVAVLLGHRRNVVDD